MTAPVVLQVLPEFTTGGVERGTTDIALYLQAQGVRNYVASQGGKLEETLAQVGVPHITLPLKPRRPDVMIANVFRLAALIRRHNITIIHARSRAPAWSAWGAAKLTGCAYVTTFHGFYSHGNALKRFYNKAMLKGMRIIAVSDFMRRHIMEVYGVPGERIVTIDRGTDMAYFDPANIAPKRVEKLRAAWAVPASKTILVCAGRIGPTKGQLELIEALADVQADNWHCLVVGSAFGRGTQVERLQAAIARHNLGDRVQLTGDCRDMPAAYALAHLVAAPSIIPEAFGRIQVEAQAMEKPILSSNRGAPQDTVADGVTGWLFDPENKRQFVEILERALNVSRETLAAMGRAGRDNVFTRFEKGRMCAATLQVYRAVLEKD